MAGIDDTIAQMMRDELEDHPVLKPYQYAKLRGLYPQRVYRAIRDRKLRVETCNCGSKVINVAAADEVFKIVHTSEEEEVSGRDLDTGDE